MGKGRGGKGRGVEGGREEEGGREREFIWEGGKRRGSSHAFCFSNVGSSAVSCTKSFSVCWLSVG